MRVINQSTGGCDHGFALSLLSYCHYAKVIVTRPRMELREKEIKREIYWNY
jgi:hypothetical protein